MYRFFEDLLDPLAPAPVEVPPRGTAAFFGYFLAPIKGLLAATLVVSAIYSLSELALFWFVGVIIDWMQAAGPERFLQEHGLALLGMAAVIGILRPATLLLTRALVTFSITPNLGNAKQSKFLPIAIKPEADKVTRMAAQAAKIEAGHVLLPERAPWLGDFQTELLQFPHGRHDDQVDSVSQAIHWKFGPRSEPRIRSL